MVDYLDKVGLIYLWNKIKAKFATKADLALKQDSLIYNATSGTSGTAAVTASPFTASIWRVDLSDKVTELYTGLTILLKIPVDGNGTYGTLLRIDGVNAAGDSNSNLYPVCANVTDMIGTRYAINSIIALTFDTNQYGQKLYYNSTSAITTTSNGTGWNKKGCWKIADYDSNSYAYVRQYQSGANAAGVSSKYPLLARYNLTNKTGTYDTAYSRYHTGATVDTTTGNLEAPAFVKTNGTSSQFLKADGSVDNKAYITNADLPAAITTTEMDNVLEETT